MLDVYIKLIGRMICQWGEVCTGRLLYVRINRGMNTRPSGSRGAKVKRSDSAPIRVSRFSGTGSEHQGPIVRDLK